MLVSGDQWGINIQNNPLGPDSWRSSRTRFANFRVDGAFFLVDVQSDDGGGGDEDFNDLILTLSKPLAESEWIVYGTAKSYKGLCPADPLFPAALCRHRFRGSVSSRRASISSLIAAAPRYQSTYTVSLRREGDLPLWLSTQFLLIPNLACAYRFRALGIWVAHETCAPVDFAEKSNRTTVGGNWIIAGWLSLPNTQLSIEENKQDAHNAS